MHGAVIWIDLAYEADLEPAQDARRLARLGRRVRLRRAIGEDEHAPAGGLAGHSSSVLVCPGSLNSRFSSVLVAPGSLNNRVPEVMTRMSLPGSALRSRTAIANCLCDVTLDLRSAESCRSTLSRVLRPPTWSCRS